VRFSPTRETHRQEDRRNTPPAQKRHEILEQLTLLFESWQRLVRGRCSKIEQQIAVEEIDG